MEVDCQGHDGTTQSEGANLNIRVGSLLNLVRALAKDRKIVVLKRRHVRCVLFSSWLLHVELFKSL